MLFSVIVTTYNRPDALAAVLEGLLAQRGAVFAAASDAARSSSPIAFETLVADDGSGAPTRAVVDALRPRFHGALEHVWHPDEGFRAGTIRNRAAARARGERLIFLDGDCVPRPGFIAAHAAAAERDGACGDGTSGGDDGGSEGGRGTTTMARGSRALLSPRLTERVLRDRLLVHDWRAGRWLAARLRGDVNRLSGVIDLPWSHRARGASRDWRSVRTCNLAVWRRDFERVNGFDERYVGWGYEDSDLAIRLINSGVLVRRAGAATTVLHLWHPENDRRFEGENLARLEATKRSGVTRAETGLAEATT